MRTELRLTLALALALVLQLLPWTQLTRHHGALYAAALTIGVILATGWVLRRLRAPAPAIVVAQGVVWVTACVVSVWRLHGPAQVEASALLTLPAQGVTFIHDSSAPLFPHPGATLLLVAVVGLLALIADAVAITGDRPGWAILPLVTLHLVMALGLATPTLFGEFVLLAVGIVLVLVAANTRGADDLASRAVTWLTAGALTAATVGLTFVAAGFVPPFEPRAAQAPLQMNDPTLDLKRNLVQGSDEIILRYRTDSPGGTYLKLASLPAFTAEGFGLADVRVATGRLPNPPGSPRGVPRSTSVEIGEFSSEWLPVPYAPTSFEAPGEWGFALDTLDVMAMAGPDRANATLGIGYVVESLEVAPDPATLASATSDGGPARDLTTALPTNLPQPLRALAHEITQDAPTAGAKAMALEAYLRSDRFTYSTAPTTGVGDGLATIEDFLFGSRTGYCEQFAGAMAILAREVGIPTRMAVGFVPGTEENGTWGVSARDLHTWPELWLDDHGWVAFEPTPARGEAAGANTTPTTEEEVPAPATAAAPTPEPEPETPSPTPEPDAAAPAPTGSPSWLGWLALALVVVAAGVAAYWAPRLLRARRRTARLAGGVDPRTTTLAAWEEVRETVGDVRAAWPEGSPRFAAERLVPSLGDDAAAAQALRTLAAATERALFDRAENYAGQGSWHDEVTAITAALEAEAAEQRSRTGARRAVREEG
ncbi:MAG: DUF3488 and transglutaminase-like domain-containing protein [Propionibacteriaceae bacterium]|nr:DUF3488 and transglutaminase-like domain-containing protein [Propionibacteriaceae bacterium]